MKIIMKTMATVLLMAMLVTSVSYALSVYEVDYDHDDKKVEFNFDSRVRYKKCKVVIIDTVTDKKISLRLGEKDNDELKVLLGRRLKLGRVYRYTISNIAPKSTGITQTLAGKFTARDWD